MILRDDLGEAEDHTPTLTLKREEKTTSDEVDWQDRVERQKETTDMQNKWYCPRCRRWHRDYDCSFCNGND